MPLFFDQTGFEVEIKNKPTRIISLVPSQSEFLWDLGLKNELVGITKFCIHPHAMFRSVTRVGGTKKLDLDKIRALKPDLIIGNKEENEKSDIDALRKEFPVWMSDIVTLSDAFKMMSEIGFVVGKKEEAEHLVSKIKNALADVKELFNRKSAAYFIWKNPYMVAAEGTFINSLMEYVGFKNACLGSNRYPEISLAALRELKPEFIFLSSEPYPFKENDMNEIQMSLPGSKVMIVDGEMFSWYGTRLLKTGKYLKELLN